MRIWKYQLEITGLTFLDIPKGAEFLSMQVQNGLPCMWFLVENEQERERRVFVVKTTGAELWEDPGVQRYIGTFQTGGFVGHVFEEPHD